MYIEKLSLFNFKNYESKQFDFSDKINCIVGLNGSGKTNLLDAIYYLCLTKSAHLATDSQSIKQGESSCFIKGLFKKGEDKFEIVCSLQQNKKKSFQVNKTDYIKLSEHIGKFPAVLIIPNDSDIIRGSGELRRKFLDGMMAQIQYQYLTDLIKYNHMLKQRNSLLKNTESPFKIDLDLIHIYDTQLLELQHTLCDRRQQFIKEYAPLIQAHYENLSDGKERVSVYYKSDVLEEGFDARFKNNLQKDIISGRTQLGIHRDDYLFSLNDQPIKRHGSQGQQKTFLIALKLAQFQKLGNVLNIKPILLLDDIFDKLDEQRIAKLMHLISDQTFSQVFISDARGERIEYLIEEFKLEANLFNLDSI